MSAEVYHWPVEALLHCIDWSFCDFFFQVHIRRALPSLSPTLRSRRLQVARMWGRVWGFPVFSQVSFKSLSDVCVSALMSGRLQWLRSSAGVWVASLWQGLLLRTAGASHSCDKCSSHGDRGHFSQTNYGGMFICVCPPLESSACLPLSLDRKIRLCVCVFVWSWYTVAVYYWGHFLENPNVVGTSFWGHFSGPLINGVFEVLSWKLD